MPSPQSSTPAPEIAAPASPPAVAIPEAPAIAVATPSPSISFAVPVKGLTKLADANRAAHGVPIALHATTNAPSTNDQPAGASGDTGSAVTAPAITHLTYGVGEGNQPPPDYPREAALAGQEGPVILRFSVDDTGRVTAVTITKPSHWPLLNRAATQAIRDTWRFNPGLPRQYEVTIEFQLHH